MELTATAPDVSLWRLLRAGEQVCIDGTVVPGLLRTVYRYQDGEGEDRYSCAHYSFCGEPVMEVWGVVGEQDCCRFHRVLEKGSFPEFGAVGAPTVCFDGSRLFIGDNEYVCQ